MMRDRTWYLSESHFQGAPILLPAITVEIYQMSKQVLIKVQVDMYMLRGQLNAVQSRSQQVLVLPEPKGGITHAKGESASKNCNI